MKIKSLPSGLVAALSMTAAVQAAVTLPTDAVAGVRRDPVTGNSVALPQAGNYPTGEAPPKATDGIASNSNKYLSFPGAGLDSGGATSSTPTGFIVTLTTPSAINQIRFAIANDSPSRDPLTILIEGTNALGTADALASGGLGSDFTLVYSGASGIASGAARTTAATVSYGDYVNFTTSASYRAYRVIITDLVRYPGNAPTNFQFSELELNLVPEPSSLALVGLGGLAMLRRRRR